LKITSSVASFLLTSSFCHTFHEYRSGQFKLRSAAERKLPEKPKNTSTHAFSLEKIVARRIAIEGEDYDEQKAKDDWEQEWDD
jgi:hypothetical protein